MGCDIHIIAQRKTDSGWEEVTGDFAYGGAPFDWRSYGMFGFLADVRNYSAVPPLSAARGLPADFNTDMDEYGGCFLGDHSFSWLSLNELLAFDYDQSFEDRRVTRQTGPNSWDGGVTADPGDGAMTTFREFLGEAFFNDLAELRRIGADRIVFGFDS